VVQVSGSKYIAASSPRSISLIQNK